MAERKVLNKYYPPDFDPAKADIIAAEGRGGGQHKVRLMAPFSMRCGTCGEYIYKGTKFNARKEIVWGEEYLSIRVYRFYIRCPRCSAEMTFKTDPRNADYIAEHGMKRNFEAWRDEKHVNEEVSFRAKMEERLDPMKKLENKTVDSKREMDILEALDEVRTKNAMYEKVNADMALDIIAEKQKTEQGIRESAQKAVEDEDSRIAAEVFSRRAESRKISAEEEEEASRRDKRIKFNSTARVANTSKTKKDKVVLVKKKSAAASKKIPKLLVADYGDDD